MLGNFVLKNVNENKYTYAFTYQNTFQFFKSQSKTKKITALKFSKVIFYIMKYIIYILLELIFSDIKFWTYTSKKEDIYKEILETLIGPCGFQTQLNINNLIFRDYSNGFR